jgi:hypothetical protein
VLASDVFAEQDLSEAVASGLRDKIGVKFDDFAGLVRLGGLRN